MTTALHFPEALAGAWGDFGGLTGRISNLPRVIEMSITDHPGIAITYDYRIHQMIRNLAIRRAVDTDHFDSMPNAQSGIRAAVLRGSETQADTARKEMAKQKTAKEKDAKTRAGKDSDSADRAKSKAPPKGKHRPDGDWAAWKRKQNADATTKDKGKDDADKAEENKANRSKKK